jgi:hypothetical protein
VLLSREQFERQRASSSFGRFIAEQGFHRPKARFLRRRKTDEFDDDDDDDVLLFFVLETRWTRKRGAS